MSDESVSDIEQTLGRIREEGQAEIITPTGKMEVYYDSQYSEFEIHTKNGYQRGGSAKMRLKDVLEHVGTECNVQPDTDRSEDADD